MDRTFFVDLDLPLPRYNLDIGSGSHATQTGKILIGVEEVLIDESPDFILVQGDTNSVLAGALAAVKLDMKVGHVEAGLRSYDRGMPEEINRVLVDHVSDFLFAPTEVAKMNLIHEGIPESKVFVTGNTIVDAIHQNLEMSKRKGNSLEKLHLTPREYFLVTAHRAENVDDGKRLSDLIEGLERIRKEFKKPVVFPIHPRTRKQVQEFKISLDGITVIDPLGFLDFLQLEANASLVLTDSGGMQEECCILGVPCVTLRDNTERPETLEVGANVIAGTDPQTILEMTKKMSSVYDKWENPFGDGKSGETIMNILSKEFS